MRRAGILLVTFLGLNAVIYGEETGGLYPPVLRVPSFRVERVKPAPAEEPAVQDAVPRYRPFQSKLGRDRRALLRSGRVAVR